MLAGRTRYSRCVGSQFFLGQKTQRRPLVRLRSWLSRPVADIEKLAIHETRQRLALTLRSNPSSYLLSPPYAAQDPATR